MYRNIFMPVLDKLYSKGSRLITLKQIFLFVKIGYLFIALNAFHITCYAMMQNIFTLDS